MLNHRQRQLLPGALVWLLAIGTPASAQMTAQLPLQFDFVNPGARSLALGGAFIGAADDATTAFANPAGLASLARREASGELRLRRTETPFLSGGRVSGLPTGVGADTVQGPLYAVNINDHVSPAFFSLVVPFPRLTLAGYGHELVRTDTAFLSTGPFFRAAFLGAVDDRNRDLPVGGSRQVTIRNYGGAIGIRLHERLAVGGGLSVYTFDLEASFARFNWVDGDLFGVVDQSEDVITATAVQTGNDVGLGANVGVLLSLASRLKVGATFRKGPDFEFTQRDIVPLKLFDLEQTGRFKVPDVFGAGVEWRLADHIRVVGDYDFVRYSQLKTDFINVQSLASGRPERLHVDDGHEVHGGVEYQFLGAAWPFALRGGAWFDPDHSVRYEPTTANDTTDALLSAALPGRDGIVHYTFGGGIMLGRQVELNGGADISSRTAYATVSAVVRF